MSRSEYWNLVRITLQSPVMPCVINIPETRQGKTQKEEFNGLGCRKSGLKYALQRN